MGIIVRIGHDPEEAVWFIESSDLPGLSGEAPTVEALIERIPGMIADLIEENGSPEGTDAIEYCLIGS
jgi:predicted RNase H-like HicB family nuclease